MALRQSRKLGPARLAGIVGRAGLDGAPGAGPPRREPAAVDGPADRAGDPPDRDRAAAASWSTSTSRSWPGSPPAAATRSSAEPRPATARRAARLGYTHIHTAIDAYSRLAYSEFAGVENTANCVAFLDRAVAWFADQGITIERILTDNGNGYRSHAWRDRCAELGINHTRTQPYHPPPTARSNASTAPCSTNGPTPASGRQTPAEPEPLTASSTATTITDTTPPSAAHPPAASPTWQGTTASRDARLHHAAAIDYRRNRRA